MDLTEFIAARLDEDEATAKGLAGATRFVDGDPDFYGVGGPAAAAFWNHFNETRVLREIAAKRRILTEVVEQIDDLDAFLESERGSGTYKTTGESRLLLSLLALPYSDHPDYDPAWAPTKA